MDGLLGGSQLGTLGLLGLNQDEINRAKGQAQSDMYFALASQLLGGGPTGASIAKGLQMGQKAYRDALSEQTSERMNQIKVAEYIRSQQEAQAAKARQAAAERILQTGVIPGQTTYEQLTPQQIEQAAAGQRQVGQTTTPASLDLARVAPQLMATPEGRKILKDISPEYKAVGDYLYQITPGAVPTVVGGQPKGPTSLQEFNAAQANPAYAKFLVDQTAAKAPKIAVDLKDPTAVAKAQADVLKDWRGVVKDSGAMEVADRFKAAQQAVLAGNSGNKAADGALIYAIGKIYDPSGAVQEGDKQTILGNRSIPDSIKAYAQKAFSGQSLLPDERNGLLSVAQSIVESKSKNLEAQKAPYASISSQLGGNGSLLLNPLADVLTQQPADLATQAAQILKQRRGGK